MNDRFKVSIITPSFNSEKTIRETFASILSQTYSNWEWIVIDDFSNDNTIDLIQQFQNNESRIILLRTSGRLGAAKARNLGIEKASGRFIAFLDSDDMWEPNKLEKQVSFMLENNHAFTYSNYFVLYPNGKKKEYIPKKNKTNYKSLLKINDIGCLTVVYDREKIPNIYMPIDAIMREDYAFWLDITKLGFEAYKLNLSLATYRISRSSVSSKKLRMIKYQYLLYRKHEKFNVIRSIFLVATQSINKIFFKY